MNGPRPSHNPQLEEPVPCWVWWLSGIYAMQPVPTTITSSFYYGWRKFRVRPKLLGWWNDFSALRILKLLPPVTYDAARKVKRVGNWPGTRRFVPLCLQTQIHIEMACAVKFFWLWILCPVSFNALSRPKGHRGIFLSPQTFRMRFPGIWFASAILTRVQQHSDC